MSLTGALNIGKTALAVSQAAITVTGNNIANAGTDGYTRQVAKLSPARDRMLAPGTYVGTGVNLDTIQRQIDEALESRIRVSVSDSEAADVTQQWLGRVEAVFNELTDEDVSTQMSTFFNSWSNLANKPQDIGLRQIVLTNGADLASGIRGTRSQLSELRSDVDDRLQALVGDADTLAQKVADLNVEIVKAEGGGPGQANGLRDQRDAVLKQLAALVPVTTQEQPTGIVNVYVGSDPLVLNGTNRGITLRQETVDGEMTTAVVFKADGGELKLGGAGQLGALSDVRGRITTVIEQLDGVAGSLIFELNKLHATGQGLEGVGSVAATQTVAQTNVPLTSDLADLPFKPQNGSFVVHVKDKATGLSTSTLVKVDLDGLNGNDTTLDSLAADINAIANVSASSNNGRLSIATDSPAVEITFSQDTSGVLASLGVNGFFKGKDAQDIAVADSVAGNPRLLAAARNGQPADNQTARLIAQLETTAVATQGGQTIKQGYEGMVNGVAAAAATAANNADASKAVRETLETQRESLSGVSMDEEAINLMKYQRAYQGAAKLVQTVDELMQTLMQLL
jgi:flagellar hook-associated protein 1 FlgK